MPERWLHCNNDPARELAQPSVTDPTAAVQGIDAGLDTFEKDKKEAFQPFNVGPRNCIGINLAYAEMYIILRRLMWEFDLSSVDDPAVGKVPIV